MKTKHYKISPLFARRQDIPTSFVAIELRETARALYVYGHGEIDPHGSCCRCGRTLTHPGSILLGIGPECIGDWSARDVRMENPSQADKDYLKSLIREKIVDCWIPKSIIKREEAVGEIITAPEKHKMLNGKVRQKTARGKQAKKWKEDKIALTFPYEEETLHNVRKLPERKWHSDGKYWTCLISKDAINSLVKWGFKLDADLELIHSMGDIDIEGVESVQVPGFKKELYAFQEKGVGFLEAKDGRGLLGDEMGLGKTIQALAYLQLHPDKAPIIIVCPSSLKLNWAREIKDCLSDDRQVEILSGTKPHDIFCLDILIINYDILQYWMTCLKDLNPKVIITDEAHYYKSNTAKRTKAVKRLAKGVPHFIALTGTPIINRPIEIYNAVNIIEPTVFPSYWEFAKKYCGAKHNGFGWDFSGATNTGELHEKLAKSIMIRRKKSEVLKDLPDKVKSFIPFELDNWKEYVSAEVNFKQYITNVKGEKAAEKASNAEILVQIEVLKQIAIKGKMKAVIEWIENFIDIEGKLVVFAIHKEVINTLMAKFGDIAVKIDGSVNNIQRDKNVRRFQEDDKIRLFVGNIQAAGIGLTLTASSNVAFIELPWAPGLLVQAEDRVHRIGQVESVNIYFLLAQKTIDEKIAMMLDNKTKVLDAVLDGKVTEQDSLLTEIMNKYLLN